MYITNTYNKISNHNSTQSSYDFPKQGNKTSLSLKNLTWWTLCPCCWPINIPQEDIWILQSIRRYFWLRNGMSLPQTYVKKTSIRHINSPMFFCFLYKKLLNDRNLSEDDSPNASTRKGIVCSWIEVIVHRMSSNNIFSN